MTVIHFQTQPSPGSTEEASRWIQRCLVPFAPRARAHALSTATLGQMLARARLGQMPGRPNAATHCLALRDVPHSQFAKADVTLHVGSKAGSVIRLESTLPLAELQGGFRQVATDGAISAGWAGELGTRVGGLNQLCFRPTPPEGPMPEGAVCVPGQHGFLLMACAATTAPEAVRASVESLARAVVGPAHARAELVTEPAQPAARDASIAPPSPPATILIAPNPDETMPILPSRIRAANVLPFSGSTGDETLQALFARPTDLVDESGDTVAFPIPGGPAARLPILSFDQYVELRALLTLFGVDHEPTWLQFGLSDKTARELVQLRFAHAFASDSLLRDRFVRSVQARVTSLRAALP